MSDLDSLKLVFKFNKILILERTMVKIQEYIKELSEKHSSQEIADKLGISVSMVSHYKKGYNASIEVAVKVYKAEKLVLFPFSEEALKELSK
jgi:transcriptional regulator with XRE-family HTH domain